MNFCKNLIGAILLLFLGACSTSKEVVYFQDLRPGESELALTDPVEIKIQPKDKLSILVNSQDLSPNQPVLTCRLFLNRSAWRALPVLIVVCPVIR